MRTALRSNGAPGSAGAERLSRRPARAGRGRSSRQRGTAPGLPRPGRGAPPRPALQDPTRGWDPAWPGSRPRRRPRTRARQGGAPPPRRTPPRRSLTPRRGSRDREKTVASGLMAPGLGVGRSPGLRQAGGPGRGARAAAASERALRAAFSDASAIFDAPFSARPSGRVQASSEGLNLSVFSIASSGPAPNQGVR